MSSESKTKSISIVGGTGALGVQPGNGPHFTLTHRRTNAESLTRRAGRLRFPISLSDEIRQPSSNAREDNHEGDTGYKQDDKWPCGFIDITDRHFGNHRLEGE